MTKKAPRVEIKVAKEDSAIAGLVVKPNKAMASATTRLPPPMPAIARHILSKIRITIPPASVPRTGNTAL